MKSTIVYHPVYQKFTEYDEYGEIVKSGSFKIEERKETIIEQGHATVVFLDDGSKGVSLCHPSDNFSSSTGRKLAYLRAKIISVEKQIKEAIRSTHKN